MSQKSETVSQKWDCRRKRRDKGEIRRLSHFSATVWTGLKILPCDSTLRRARSCDDKNRTESLFAIVSETTDQYIHGSKQWHPSVWPFVRLSVCDVQVLRTHAGWNTSKIISRLISLRLFCQSYYDELIGSRIHTCTRFRFVPKWMTLDDLIERPV